MTTRPRPTSAIPRPPTSLSPSCVVADAAVLSGTQLVTIAAYATIHPRAKITALYAPVSIGEGCVVCEKASVGLLSGETEEDEEKEEGEGGRRGRGVVLGRNVVVEGAAVVEARSVGEGTIIEASAKVGRGCVIGKYVKISAHSIVPPYTTLPDFTILYGYNSRRTERPGLEGLRTMAHEKHLQVLRKLVPSNLARWTS